MQHAFRIGRPGALSEIIEPSRTVEPFGPNLGIGNVARDRPPVAAVPLSAELNLLHDCVEQARPLGIDTVLELDDDGTASRGQGKTDFGIGERIQGLFNSAADARHADPKAVTAKLKCPL